VLLRAVDQAFDHASWHGPSLRNSFRGLSGSEASWRSAPGRKSIAEICVHTAYWKYAARRILTGEKRGSFPLTGTNWFAREEPYTESAWKDDLALLDERHALWRSTVSELEPAKLGTIAKGKYTVADVVQGVAAHDLYHAGQVQLIRRMMGLSA
jgi:uncharacterized damage-inducible protein DinB